MSSKESASPSVSDGGNNRDPSESEERVGNARLIFPSELLSRYQALDREYERSLDLQKELKSAEHAMRKLNKEAKIIGTALKELWDMLETISDEELIKQFRKILELLGKSDNGVTFLFPGEARHKLIQEFGLVLKEAREYFVEEHRKQIENYDKLNDEFKIVGERLIKEGRVLNELNKSLLLEYGEDIGDDED